MAIRKFNQTNESMAQLIAVFRQLHDEMKLSKDYYEQLKNEAQQSFRDSQTNWSEKTNSEQQQISKAAGEKLAKMDEMVQGIESIEIQLITVDKSYAKRRNTEYVLQEDKNIKAQYDNTTDYFSKLAKVHDEAIAIARECSLSVKAQPIQEIGMFFSNKRKEKYERLYSLLQEAKDMRDLAYKKIQENVHTQRKNLEERQKEEIDKAADETAELIQLMEEKQQQARENMIASANEQVDGLLSSYDVETLAMMEIELDKNDIELPETCCEYISIGNLKVDLSTLLPYADIVDYINNHYQGHIWGNELLLPAIYDIGDNFDFLFNNNGSTDEGKAAIHSIIFSLLKNSPASRQAFYLFDPEGRSKGFDTYLDFAKAHSDIMGGKIYTTKEMMKSTILELSRYADEIGQTKLVGYKNIFEYNADVKDKQETLKCLCLLSFPKYFDDDMLDSLQNIVKNGKEYGMQVLIDCDVHELADLRSESTKLLIDKIMEECILLNNDFGKWKYKNGTVLSLKMVPTIQSIREFEGRFMKQYEEIKNSSLPLLKIIPKELWYEGDSKNNIAIPIGKNEDGEVQNLVFGEGTSHHAMIIGSLGSGKSTLLHTIIMSAITKYSPDEVNLYLMDFKGGTEFKVYADCCLAN